jgi:hypothetical protein
VGGKDKKMEEGGLGCCGFILMVWISIIVLRGLGLI